MQDDKFQKAFKSLAENNTASPIISQIASMREREIVKISKCHTDFDLRFLNGRISAYDEILRYLKAGLLSCGKEIVFKLNSDQLEVSVEKTSSDMK